MQKNDFLKQLAKEQVIELVECMFEMRARSGQWIIQEGEPGDRLFVIAEGQAQVSREGQQLGQLGPGTVMGELAILYNCTRYGAQQFSTLMSIFQNRLNPSYLRHGFMGARPKRLPDDHHETRHGTPFTTHELPPKSLHLRKPIRRQNFQNG